MRAQASLPSRFRASATVTGAWTRWQYRPSGCGFGGSVVKQSGARPSIRAPVQAHSSGPSLSGVVSRLTVRSSRRRFAARLNSSVIRAVVVQSGGVAAQPRRQSFSLAPAQPASVAMPLRHRPSGKAGAPAPCSPRSARSTSCIRPRTGSRSGHTALRASVRWVRQRSLPACRRAHNRLPVHTGTVAGTVSPG
jgi:hypothetical protein